ncbi:Aste57867_2940 [Aphanomyces stellatus]|uniref:Aste57867_2940 protein n=1 Tax=Aphanomyces stellatus TaxID=120398 RepID=A0A485KDW2_9STRA|nr:hypothetical protein As57867_002932 [Aphanomyces stellatus]VFT80123.1 Aste57867_2940 [Aphanomyces stellatus]
MGGAVWQKYMKMPRQMDIPARVDAYWNGLTMTERQSVLFLDEAELVKQLYKLNFSLLCVGLMQRRLKKNAEEPTYELLEAMEFMDIGTGIMTVKNELVQDGHVQALFALIQGSLHGFLVESHVLSDKDFQQLFFQDSEGISTWDEYQQLIAILLEQLILKSFVAFLERESIRQMEALLQEVDQEAANDVAPKKSKKKKKRRKLHAAPTSPTSADAEEVLLPLVLPPSPLPLSPATKATHTLNPTAVEFKPLLPLKRKFDSFVVHVDEDDFDESPRQSDEWTDDVRDVELDAHLASIYQLTSEMFGWDFEQQCEYNAAAWTESAAPEFFMTDSVVRYFSHSALCTPPYARRREVDGWRRSFHDPRPVQDYQDAYFR